MPFKADFSKNFEADFRRLSDADKQITLNKIALLEDNPRHPSLRTKKLKGYPDRFESSVNMSIRIIWQYRNNRILLLLEIGHHDILKKY